MILELFFLMKGRSSKIMSHFIHILTLALTVLLLSCNVQTKSETTNGLQHDTLTQDKSEGVKMNPRDYVKNYGGENNKLFVFVGQKISIDNLPDDKSSMDLSFKAKYKVLQKVFGNFLNDTIEFLVYDHYGIPPFSEFDNVLLFVSADSGTYYHQKYMFNDVYMTKNGKWAGSYAKADYGHLYNKQTKVKPIKIEFVNEVSYPATYIDDNGKSKLIDYPKPYFKIVGDRAVAVYGNYIEELFILKRDGFLTAREIFKDGVLNE